MARGHQGLQAAGGERARDRAHTLTSESQAPDRELPPLWPEAPGLWSRAGPTPPLTTAPDTPGPSRSREAQPGKDGRVSFSSVFMKRSRGSHGQMQAAAGAPPSCSGTGRPSQQLHDGRHCALPEDEGADQHGDHPPGLQAAPAESTNPCQPRALPVSHRRARPVPNAHGVKTGRITGDNSSCPPLTCRDGFLRQQEIKHARS